MTGMFTLETTRDTANIISDIYMNRDYDFGMFSMFMTDMRAENDVLYFMNNEYSEEEQDEGYEENYLDNFKDVIESVCIYLDLDPNSILEYREEPWIF